MNTMVKKSVVVAALLVSSAVDANTLQLCRNAILQDIAKQQGVPFKAEGTQIGYDAKGHAYTIVMEGTLLGFSDHNAYRCKLGTDAKPMEVLVQRGGVQNRILSTE